MALPIALQLYSVRDSMDKDMEATLRKVKEMGYDGVEFAGLFGKDPAQVRKWCEEIGLTPISAHVSLNPLMDSEERAQALKEYGEIGCKYIVVPYVYEDRRPDGELFEETIDVIAEIGKIVHEHGMTLLYHNHDFEFRKRGDEYGLDILYSRIPADYLQTELDTCWVNVAGEDPAEYLRKYTGRSPVVHLKDFHISGKLPKHLYELIGLEEENVEEEESTFEFRPVGHGMQNIPSILEASVDAGSSWLVVEQDEPTPGMSRMECVAKSREYLKSLGW